MATQILSWATLKKSLAAPRSAATYSICEAAKGTEDVITSTDPYQQYHNEVGTHLSLKNDAPIPLGAQSRVRRPPILGGLHHGYVRHCVSTKTAG